MLHSSITQPSSTILHSSTILPSSTIPPSSILIRLLDNLFLMSFISSCKLLTVSCKLHTDSCKEVIVFSCLLIIINILLIASS